MAQFLGFLAWLFMEIAGFWCIAFLATFPFIWIPMWLNNTRKEKAGIVTAEEPRQILPNQEGISVLFKK